MSMYSGTLLFKALPPDTKPLPDERAFWRLCEDSGYPPGERPRRWHWGKPSTDALYGRLSSTDEETRIRRFPDYNELVEDVASATEST